MDFFTAADVIASGLSAERTLMNTTSSNLANAQTTRTADGGPYRRLDPVFRSASTTGSFASVLAGEMTPGVQVAGVVRDAAPPRLVYNPNHPDADTNGMVAMPNVNVVEEMVNMMQASRAYEAGLSAMGTLSQMANRAIGIGK